MEKVIYDKKNGLWYELQGDYGNCQPQGDLCMRKGEYYLCLTAEERRYIFNALLAYRNKLII